MIADTKNDCYDSSTTISFVPIGGYITKRTGPLFNPTIINVCQVMAGNLPNTSTPNPEVDALKAKVQALETKVYQCVQ